MRELPGKTGIAAGAVYLAFVGWSIYGAIWPVETYAFRMVHMALIFLLGFIAFPIHPRAGRWTGWIDLLLALLGVATIVYALWDLDAFIRRSTLPEKADLLLGIAAILLLV